MLGLVSMPQPEHSELVGFMSTKELRLKLPAMQLLPLSGRWGREGL